MEDRWIDNWDACNREIESWLDDAQLLAELGRRSALAMLGCHPDLKRDDASVPLLLRRLLAADWLEPAMPPCAGAHSTGQSREANSASASIGWPFWMNH